MESHEGMESHGASSGVSPPAHDLTIGPRRGVESAASPVRRIVKLGPISRSPIAVALRQLRGGRLKNVPYPQLDPLSPSGGCAHRYHCKGVPVLSVTCRECTHRIGALEELAGRRAKCGESARNFVIPAVRLVETTCLSLALTLALISAAICHGAEPPKPTLKIALDGSQESQILKAELTRDWRPNTSVCSTPGAYSQADANLRPLRDIQRRIFNKFCITFVSHPEGVDCPAVLIGGKWEQLNPWAFTCETRCLLTLDWMIRRREWWTSDARDSSPNGDSKDKTLSEEDGGWSGGDDGSAECAPPWAPPPKQKQKQK
jgi:hypothetical protein